MAATLDTGTKALFRRHILKTLGWADVRRDRKGNWFVKEQPRAENKFKSRWLPDRLFTDAELMGDLSDGRIKA
jgi:hypothetical protein